MLRRIITVLFALLGTTAVTLWGLNGGWDQLDSVGKTVRSVLIVSAGAWYLRSRGGNSPSAPLARKRPRVRKDENRH